MIGLMRIKELDKNMRFQEVKMVLEIRFNFEESFYESAGIVQRRS